MTQNVIKLLEEIRDDLRALRQESRAADRFLVSRTEAARRLGVRKAKIADLIASGRLQTTKDGGRDKIHVDSLKRLSESGDLAPKPRRRTRGRTRPPADDDQSIVWPPKG